MTLVGLRVISETRLAAGHYQSNIPITQPSTYLASQSWSTHQVVWKGGVDWPGDDEADGVLAGLAEDGGDLLGAHAPQAHVADGQQVVPILQAPVLQTQKG